jgi:hypothetical protein
MTLTNKELITRLIEDMNISDNIDVESGYELDRFGNSIITLVIEGTDDGKKKGTNGMVIMVFNEEGRMVTMEIATQKRGKKDSDWQIAASEPFVDFSKFITGYEQ